MGSRSRSRARRRAACIRWMSLRCRRDDQSWRCVVAKAQDDMTRCSRCVFSSIGAQSARRRDVERYLARAVEARVKYGVVDSLCPPRPPTSHSRDQTSTNVGLVCSCFALLSTSPSLASISFSTSIRRVFSFPIAYSLSPHPTHTHLQVVRYSFMHHSIPVPPSSSRGPPRPEPVSPAFSDRCVGPLLAPPFPIV